jgi:hypothetical protein
MEMPIADGSLSFVSLPLLFPHTAIIRPFDITGNYRV